MKIYSIYFKFKNTYLFLIFTRERDEKMEDLIESILDYIRSDYTDYAIMINGEWGSGKTYFWNNKIRPKIENIYVIIWNIKFRRN